MAMAIGLSVDFTLHIAHAFMHFEGEVPARIEHALLTMGKSVLSGGVSTLLGVLVCIDRFGLSVASTTEFLTVCGPPAGTMTGPGLLVVHRLPDFLQDAAGHRYVHLVPPCPCQPKTRILN